MVLTVERFNYSRNSTIGRMLIDGIFYCYTLEDVCRDLNRDGDLNDNGETKVFSKTAIPSGRYRLVISFSNRFKKYMPEVLNVAGFSGIRIHNGNTPDHTEGCILVGKSVSKDFVGHSKETFSRLMAKLQIVDKQEKLFIEIKDMPAV